MLRLRFQASWLPEDHSQFWTFIDRTKNIETISHLIDYFNEQQKLLADHYQFHLPKRSTKVKYLKAFVNQCVLPPHAQAFEMLRDNDQIEFRLEIEAQEQWLCSNSAPTLKRKHSIEPSTDNLNNVLRALAQPSTSTSTSTSTFTFQFGNKRGRPIPPRPAVISSVKVNSLVPRQVFQKSKT